MTARPGGNKEDLALRDIRYCRADAYGHFRLEGIEPGVELRALSMAPGFVIGASEPIVVQAGTTIDIGERRMQRAGRLHVQRPIGLEGDINMHLVPMEGAPLDPTEPLSERWSSIFDAETVDGLQPGTWSVTVSYRTSGSSEERREHTETIDVRAGETCVIELRR